MFKKNVYEEYNKLIVNNIKLPLEDNEVPQGICRVNNTILVSCYMDTVSYTHLTLPTNSLV